jgi:hypothetical protein
MKYHMSNGLVKKWEALFLTDGILFHDLVGGMPMGIDKETLQSSCFWIRSSAPRQQTMLEYFRKFEQFNFSTTTLARVLREDENDEAGETDPFLKTLNEKGLGDLFFAVFIRADFEYFFDNEAAHFEGGHIDFEETLREVDAVCPPALRLVLGAHSLGMFGGRPLFCSLFHLALIWNTIAPEKLRFPSLVIAENPHPNGAFDVGSARAWYRDVALCDEFKPLAMLGTLVDKSCSHAEKCTRLELSAPVLEEVEAFIASNLTEELRNSLRLHIEPKDIGTSGAMGAIAAELENAAEVLAGLQAGCMLPYFYTPCT